MSSACGSRCGQGTGVVGCQTPLWAAWDRGLPLITYLECPVAAQALPWAAGDGRALPSSSSPYLAVPLAIYGLPQLRYRELEKGYTHAHQRQTQAACTPYPSRTVGGTLQPQLWLPCHRALHLAFTSTFTLANHDAPKSRSQFCLPVPDLSAFCSGPKFSRVSRLSRPESSWSSRGPRNCSPIEGAASRAKT